MRGWLCVTSIVIFITFATRSASCQKDNICQKLLTSFFFNPKGTWVMTKNRKLRLKMSHSKHCLTANFRFFKNPPKVTISGIFNELLSNQNVNVAHFARNVKWDFFCDVQPPCMPLLGAENCLLLDQPPKTCFVTFVECVVTNKLWRKLAFDGLSLVYSRPW